MRAHSAAALELARWLEAQPGVSKVYYAGLESHPQHALAKRQQSGFGGIVAFEVEQGREGAWAFVDAIAIAVHHREPGRYQDHDHSSGDDDPFANHAGRARARRHH